MIDGVDYFALLFVGLPWILRKIVNRCPFWDEIIHVKRPCWNDKPRGPIMINTGPSQGGHFFAQKKSRTLAMVKVYEWVVQLCVLHKVGPAVSASSLISDR